MLWLPWSRGVAEVSEPSDLAGINWGPLAQLAARQLFSRPSVLEQLQVRMLALQVAKLEQAVAVVSRFRFEELLAEDRTDYVICGERGAGKTAFAVALAQLLDRSGRKPYGVDMPQQACEALGLTPLRFADALGAEGAALVVDEAELRVPSGKRQRALYELLALARQSDTCVLWTSQGLSGVARDVLRQGCVYAFLRLDPMAIQWDREEALPILSQVVRIQQAMPELAMPGGVVLCGGGRFAAACDVPLPAGWTDRTSRLWRVRW